MFVVEAIHKYPEHKVDKLESFDPVQFSIYLDYMGWSHVKELFMGWVVSVISWALISWLLLDWLLRFKNNDPGEGCCAGGIDNRPDSADPKEFRVFFGLINLSAAFCVITIFVLVRTMYAHWLPTRAFPYSQQSRD